MRLSRLFCFWAGLIFIMGCQSKPPFGVSWYAAVYQNPSNQYLDTLNLSDLPRERLFCFIEMNSLDSIQHSSFRLKGTFDNQPIEMVVVPKESLGFDSGGIKKRYIIATRYLEEKAIVDSLIKDLKETYLIRISRSKSDTISLISNHLERTNELKVEDAIKVLSRGVEKASE